MYKNVFMLPVSFTGSYTEDEPTYHQQKNDLNLQKIVSGVDKVVNFKDFDQIQGHFKTTTKIHDLFKIVRTMETTCTWTYFTVFIIRLAQRKKKGRV